MVGPIWLRWLLAGLMLFSALYHAGRLVTARRHGSTRRYGRTHRYDVDLTHLVMSSGMAAMLVISFSGRAAMAWSVVIGVLMMWFILRTARVLGSGGRSLTAGGARALYQPMQQVSMCVAMLFMLAVGSGPASAATPAVTDAMVMPGMTGGMTGDMTMGGQVSHELGASTSLVAATSLVLVGALCLVAARHILQLRAAVAAHRVGLGCQLAMSGTMIYLLVLMA